MYYKRGILKIVKQNLVAFNVSGAPRGSESNQITIFVAIMFVSCSSGEGGDDISPCHDLVPTEQNSNQ